MKLFSVARFCLCVCVLPVLFASSVAGAQPQSYPSKPIRFVVPYPAGGPLDTVARLLGQKVGESVKQPVIVDNKPGAGGNIGADAVAKSPPDGYTILMGAVATHAINPTLYAGIPYDAAKDFIPVTQVASTPNVLVVNPSVPAGTVREFIAYAKANPGKLNYASPGPGSGAHLAGELLKSSAGVEMVHVPFNGIAPAVTAVVAGDVQVMFAGSTSAMPHVATGKLRALGVASPKRMVSTPALPTLDESGLPGFDVTSWYSIVAPAATPPAVIERLQKEIAKALDTLDVKAKLAGLGAEPVGNTPSEFAAMIRNESAKWGKIVKDANIRPE